MKKHYLSTAEPEGNGTRTQKFNMNGRGSARWIIVSIKRQYINIHVFQNSKLKKSGVHALYLPFKMETIQDLPVTEAKCLNVN